MADNTEMTYINGLSALAVVVVAYVISIYFLVEFIRQRKKLAPFVSLMAFCLGSFSLGPSISLLYLLITNTPFDVTVAGYLSYSFVPIAIINAMYLGFTLFQPELLKKVVLAYVATGVVFYIFIFGFPSDSLGGQLYALIPDTTLKGVPMALAVVYILSAFFVLGRGFYKLAKRIDDLEKKRKLKILFWAFLMFGFGAILEIVAPSIIIFLARILLATSYVLLYMGFSAGRKLIEQSPNTN